MRAALRYGVIGLGVLLVASVALATAVAGTAGLWGALLGSAIGGGFILATAAMVLFTGKLAPSTAQLVILASWAGKLLLALVVVGVLRRFDFFDPVALFLTVVAALLIVLGAETYGVLSQKVPYVDPPTENASETAGQS
ncbi:hypothetical protein [Nocardia harenae]|uniref:hypothetical protein n=1 Tax=Nocardia harenae TaxID=358707 RepID=UPI000AE78F76|nr:hypothetical protein [Nocardia harenae]